MQSDGEIFVIKKLLQDLRFVVAGASGVSDYISTSPGQRAALPRAALDL